MAYQDDKEEAGTEGEGEAKQTNQAATRVSRRGIAWKVLFGRSREEDGRREEEDE